MNLDEMYRHAHDDDARPLRFGRLVILAFVMGLLGAWVAADIVLYVVKP